MFLVESKDTQLYIKPQQDGGSIDLNIVDCDGKHVQQYIQLLNGALTIQPITRDVSDRLGLTSYRQFPFTCIRDGKGAYGSTRMIPDPTDVPAVEVNPNDVNTFLEPVKEAA
jgi:hypothetical protein